MFAAPIAGADLWSIKRHFSVFAGSKIAETAATRIPDGYVFHGGAMDISQSPHDGSCGVGFVDDDHNVLVIQMGGSELTGELTGEWTASIPQLNG
jgi:hypothetical protein